MPAVPLDGYGASCHLLTGSVTQRHVLGSLEAIIIEGPYMALDGGRRTKHLRARPSLEYGTVLVNDG